MEKLIKKEQFIEYCKAKPEEVYDLFINMSETIVALKAQVITLNGQVNILQAEIKELKSRLDKNSRNSNKPPSTDEFVKPKSQRKKSNKKSGGQKGHPGHTLKMSANPDRVIIHRHKHCSCCGHELEHQAAEKRERRQVFDVPPPKIDITEHISETVSCPGCGLANKGSFPEDVTQPVQYGKGIIAQIVYLNQYQLVPYNRIVEYFDDIYNLSISEATIYNAISTLHETLAPAEEEIISGLLKSAVLHVDETGMRVEGKRKWLHVVSNSTHTHYRWHEKRGSTATDEIGILPYCDGVMVHDFWKPYYKYSCIHSLCNIHNIRELNGILELTGQEWPQEMIDLLLEIKGSVDALLPGFSLETDEKKAYIDRYNKIISEGYLANPPPRPSHKRGRPKQGRVRNMLNRLSEHRDEVLAFMENSSVPFDNNQAERDIRMMKVKQKISGVFRSAKGADMFCRIRGYISTAKKNSVSAFSAISEALHDKPFVPVV